MKNIVTFIIEELVSRDVRFFMTHYVCSTEGKSSVRSDIPIVQIPVQLSIKESTLQLASRKNLRLFLTVLFIKIVFIKDTTIILTKSGAT